MKLRWLVIIIGLSILIIALAYGIKYLKTSKKPVVPVQSIVQTTPSRIPTPLQGNLESCDVKKEGNPLLETDPKTLNVNGEKVIVGTFKGNVNQINLDKIDKTATVSASIELVSPTGDQVYTFKVKEEKGLVYDAVNLKDLTLTGLKKGQTVVLSFNCFTRFNNLFRITIVAVTSM